MRILKNSLTRFGGLLFIAFLMAGCTSPGGETSGFDIVLSGGRVIDPDSGLDAVRNVGIRDGKIIAVSEETLEGERIIDVAGLVVAPGFIDLHAHGQTDQAFELMVRDGVTSALELEVGAGDIAAWYAEREDGKLLNYGASVGHIPVRMKVMGDEGLFLPSGPAGSEVASDSQVAEMKALLEKGLEDGSVGVGFGMAYTPSASPDEFETMMRVAADHGAPAFIHVKSGLSGLREAIATAKKAGAALHVVHANSSGGAETGRFLAIIQEARDGGQDVTTEAYPYEAGMTSIQSALFDDWQSWDDERIEKHQWPLTGEWLTRESFARYRESGGNVIIHSRTEEMTRTAIENPLVMIASDGFIVDGKGHPRTSGTYSKVLGKYVRELGALKLTDALAKMTIQPAKRLENYVPMMRNKGRIRAGADADIAVFDADEIIDQATYAEPTLASKGLPFVLVNGVLVVENGALVEGVKPGRAIQGKGRK